MIGAFIAAGATLLSVAANRQAGKAAQSADEARRENALWYGIEQKKRADFEATQFEEQAGQVFAVGQRENMEIQRISKLTQSRALALAAASGGGASSPTVVHLISKIAQRGAYEGSIAMYNAEDRARTLKINAAAKRYEGQLAEEAGERGFNEKVDYSAYNLAAGAALLQGASSMYLRYGGGGPKGGGIAGVTETY